MALAISDHDKLEALETTIETNLKAFYEIGEALKKIRDDRLYKTAGYDRFEDYCKERWEFTRMRASQLIASCDVVQNVNNRLQIPQNEFQARPLTRLSAPLQIEAWQKAVDTAPDGKVTARHVQRVVKEIIGVEISRHDEKTKTSINKAAKENIASEDFINAYEAFYRQVQIAKIENWKSTTKEACLKMMGHINDLITV